jgi:transcriptional regulator with GAF, ATPase, and Fis domain
LKITTIKLSKKNAERLNAIGGFSKTYNEVLDEILAPYNNVVDSPSSKIEALKKKMRKDAEKRTQELRRQRIREALDKSESKVTEARRLLGLDASEGETTPAWGIKKHKKD